MKKNSQSLAGGAVAGIGNEGAHPERLVRKVAVDAEAARHRRADARVVGSATPAVEAELERLQHPAVVGVQLSLLRQPRRRVLNGGREEH